MWRWLVIIARDRPELWTTWSSLYGGAVKVEIHIDRRQGQPWTGTGERPYRRALLPRDCELQERGFVVVPRPDLVGASR